MMGLTLMHIEASAQKRKRLRPLTRMRPEKYLRMGEMGMASFWLFYPYNNELSGLPARMVG